jgi:hypothetical protein
MQLVCLMPSQTALKCLPHRKARKGPRNVSEGLLEGSCQSDAGGSEGIRSARHGAHISREVGFDHAFMPHFGQ